jgi:hypothetical protein
MNEFEFGQSVFSDIFGARDVYNNNTQNTFSTGSGLNHSSTLNYTETGETNLYGSKTTFLKQTNGKPYIGVFTRNIVQTPNGVRYVDYTDSNGNPLLIGSNSSVTVPAGSYLSSVENNNKFIAYSETTNSNVYGNGSTFLTTQNGQPYNGSVIRNVTSDNNNILSVTYTDQNGNTLLLNGQSEINARNGYLSDTERRYVQTLPTPPSSSTTVNEPSNPNPPAVTPPSNSNPPVVTPPSNQNPPVVTPPSNPNPPVVTPPSNPNPPVVTPPSNPNPPVVTPPSNPNPPSNTNPPVINPPSNSNPPANAPTSLTIDRSANDFGGLPPNLSIDDSEHFNQYNPNLNTQQFSGLTMEIATMTDIQKLRDANDYASCFQALMMDSNTYPDPLTNPKVLLSFICSFYIANT